MNEIQVAGTGGLCPDWLIRIEEALAEARKEGWEPKLPFVFEGYPYIWQGEPRMATWAIEPDPEEQP